MGQDKKQLEHLLNFVRTIYNDPDNKEFVDGIQSMIKNDLQRDKSSWSDKIDEIYEYCIKKNLREQAEELYKNFPLSSIKTTLIEDYIKMEESRRNNNFDEFGEHLYQQIENIINTIARDNDLSLVVSKMLSLPAFIAVTKEEFIDGKKVVTYKREEEYTPAERKPNGKSIAEYVLVRPWNDGTPEGEEESRKKFEEKKNTPLPEQKAGDKLNIILYFIGFRTLLHSGNLESWNKNKNTLKSIYNVRNHVHRGGQPTDNQAKDYIAATQNKSLTYLRFLSALVFFIDAIEKGYPISEDLKKLALSIK